MTKLKEGWGWGGVLAAKKSAESLGGHKQKVFVPNADHTLSQTVKIKVKKIVSESVSSPNPDFVPPLTTLRLLLLFCNLWPLVFVIYKYYIIIIYYS